MLKIKDEVDLKELEKFGFNYIKNINCYEKAGRQLYWDDRAIYYVTKERELQINTEGDYTIDDIIYDLIQARISRKDRGVITLEEIWKDIFNYEGLYQVSNLGRIKSLSKFHKTNRKHSSIGYYSKEKILKPFSSKRGYLIVTLSKNGQTKNFKIHRIVATTFLENPLNKRDVNHINGDKLNNSVSNLEWVNHQENMQHAFKTGLISNIKKIKVKQYDMDGKFIKEYESISQASRQLNIKIAGLSKCLKNGKNKYKGFLWEYANIYEQN